MCFKFSPEFVFSNIYDLEILVMRFFHNLFFVGLFLFVYFYFINTNFYNCHDRH